MPERVAVRQRRVPEPEEFQNLVMALRQPYNAIVILAGLSGLRKGEIEALRWNDIGQGYVMVDEAVYQRVLGTPKSRKSRRKVSIGLKFRRLWRAGANRPSSPTLMTSCSLFGPAHLLTFTMRSLGM